MRATMKHGRSAFALAALALACSGFAIEPVTGPKLTPVPVQSQETLAGQQKHNGRLPIVGTVELKPREESRTPRATAQQKLQSPENTSTAIDRQNDAKAAMALHQVELDNQMAATAPFRKLIWAVIVVAFGLGLAFLVKFLADKSMPQVPSKTKVNW